MSLHEHGRNSVVFILIFVHIFIFICSQIEQTWLQTILAILDWNVFKRTFHVIWDHGIVIFVANGSLINYLTVLIVLTVLLVDLQVGLICKYIWQLVCIYHRLVIHYNSTVIVVIVAQIVGRLINRLVSYDYSRVIIVVVRLVLRIVLLLLKVARVRLFFHF